MTCLLRPLRKQQKQQGYELAKASIPSLALYPPARDTGLETTQNPTVNCICEWYNGGR